MTDRFADLAQVARDLGVDAVALVPGPNFTRALGRSISSHERPFMLLVTAKGETAAIVPNLELRSWALVNFDGEVFDWRDQTGHDGAFRDLAVQFPLRSVGVEGQVMRVFVHHALRRAMPDCVIVDGEGAISGLRLLKTDDEIARICAAIGISERALAKALDRVRVGMSENEVEQMLAQDLFAEGAEDHAFDPIVAAADESAQRHGRRAPTTRSRPATRC